MRSGEEACSLNVRLTLSSIPPLFATIHSTQHSARRRLLSNIYSKSYLQNSTDIASFTSHILIQNVLPKIATSAANSSSIDVLRLNTAYSMDVMAAYELGSAYRTDFLTDDAAYTSFITAFAAVKSGYFWAGFMPYIVKVLGCIGINLVPQETVRSQSEIEDMCWKLCSRVHDAAETNSRVPTSTAPVVYAQLSSALEKGPTPLVPSSTNGSDFARQSVASEMLDHLLAGHETSGIALTYTMYELSMHPALQTALRAELRTVYPSLAFPLPISERSAFGNSAGAIPPSVIPRALDALPFLNAVLYETLRLYSPGAAGLPRVVARGGAIVDGYVLPEGIVAHAAAYSVHRHEAVFERPEEWLPERWMGERKRETKDWFWAFASGSRGCIGKDFAMQGKGLSYFVSHLHLLSNVVKESGQVTL